ncbi:hypothetical protein [Oligoflexus tunisiensis]|uniref:hypothetical protein n=1 Tax=Oligoflexus tunisiensis TaxID=708132 RepID=UPI00114D29E4|nr:hypothetical protein [Oligoflexus tunisiensis]
MMKHFHGLTLAFVVLPALMSCSGSLQDRIDTNRRLCGPSQHEAFPIHKPNGERYTEADRSQLTLRTLTGHDRSEAITERACLDLPEGEDYLLVDNQERTFRIVSARLALNQDLRLQAWTLPTFAWECPVDGRKMRRGSELPMTIAADFAMKGQSLHLAIQALDREWNRLDSWIEPGLGLTDVSPYHTEWDNGEYLVTPVLTNPFGEKENLASGCRVSMFTGTPRLDVSLDEEGQVSIDGTDRLPIQTDPDVEAYYCLAAPDDTQGCQNPAQFRSLNQWQGFNQGGHYTLYLRATDAHGNTVERQPLSLVVDHSPPDIHLRWTQTHRNRLGHVERLPFSYYEASAQLADDVSPHETLTANLQCRVRMQIDSVTMVAGSFAICDEARCQGQRLEDWTPCSPDIAFRLDESFWKTFPAAKEIILEVRTMDKRSKVSTDSAMVMIDPSLYPQFTADQWEGQALDGIRDIDRLAPHHYWLLRTTSAARQIMTGTFGQWTLVDYPSALQPQALHHSEGRFFGVFQVPADRKTQLWEWLPAENRWQQPLGTEDLAMTDAGVIADRFNPDVLWAAGLKADEAFLRILPNGERQAFPCPVWNNPEAIEYPKILVQSDKLLTLLSYDRYYTLDPATGDCQLTAFPEYQGPAGKFRSRELYRDQLNRVWTTGKNQIDVLENGVWRQVDISHQGLHPQAGFTSGAYQFEDGSYVFLKSGDLIFVPDLASLEKIVFNPFNTVILKGPAPNSRGGSYGFSEVTAFFDEGSSLLSVKGGVLTQTSARPRDFYMPRQLSGGSTNLFRMEGGVLHLGLVWSGLITLSEKAMQRHDESSGMPINTASAALFEEGRLVSIFGTSQWEDSSLVRKIDVDGFSYKKDPLFESLDLRVAISYFRSAQRDAGNRLWFSMVDSGAYRKPGGNFFIQDNKLTKIQSCSPLADDASGMTCAEEFITLANGEVFWRDNRKVIHDSYGLYDLYSWSEKNGLATATGAGQTFQKIYDATEYQGELWVAGIDQEERGILGVYRNQTWETERLPDQGHTHCARLGFNRKGELYCFGRSSGVLVKRGADWTHYETPDWSLPGPGLSSGHNGFINGYRRYAYFEDGLAWISRRAGELALYDVEPTPGWDRWWLSTP